MEEALVPSCLAEGAVHGDVKNQNCSVVVKHGNILIYMSLVRGDMIDHFS